MLTSRTIHSLHSFANLSYQLLLLTLVNLPPTSVLGFQPKAFWILDNRCAMKIHTHMPSLFYSFFSPKTELTNLPRQFWTSDPPASAAIAGRITGWTTRPLLALVSQEGTFCCSLNPSFAWRSWQELWCSFYINSTFSFGHPQSGLLLVRAVALIELTQMPS